MLRWMGIIGAVAATLLVSALGAQAQNFTYRNGTITFDTKGYKQEFDQMQRDLSKQKTARRSKNYCITCADGSKLGCRAIAGGRVGQGLCLLGGAASCNPPGVSGVSSGSCGSGGATI